MANLRKINGSYYAYFYDRNRTPARKSFPIRVSLKSTAEDELKRLEKARAEGRFDPWKEDPWIGEEKTEPVVLQNAIDEFLRDRSKTVRASTIKTYRQQLEAWAEGLPATYHVLDLRPSDVEDYIYDSEIANATRRKRYRHLSTFLNWCEEASYLDQNPINQVQKPRKQSRERPVLRPDEVEELLDVIEEHRRNATNAAGKKPDVQWLIDAIIIGMYTGLRRGEIASLTWADVDLQSGQILVRNRAGSRTKTGDERSVPLRGRALSHLRAMKSRKAPTENTSYIITDRRGRKVRKDRITRRFRHFADKAGIDSGVTFHTLRHSYASLLASQGVSMQMIQRVLGHSTIKTTEKYTHIRSEKVAEKVEEALEGSTS